MKDKDLLKRVNLGWLKRMYFSDPKKYIHLQKGDILLRENQHNERLFLVLDGSLVGYLGYDSGEVFEAFRSTNDHFVGVYSFFSETHLSYSTVIAEKTSWLAYIDSHHPQHVDEEGRGFAEHFLPIVVDEIYTRQLLTQKMTMRNQEVLRRLFQAEKMAILGQLAAGLAHELNNAVGSIQRQTEWMASWISEFAGRYCEPGMQLFFRQGLREDQDFSSSEVRKRRKEIEDVFGLPSGLARQLAATNITNEKIKGLEGDIQSKLEQYLPFFEAGMALHGILGASGHASRLLGSVKELGVSNHDTQLRIDLTQTITESLLLLKDALKGIQVKLELEEQVFLMANHGEMAQVWVNLIKNAAENLKESAHKSANISIKSWKEEHHAWIQITDNGPEIPHDLLPHIFHPNVTAKVEGLSFGLGLGLSFVHRIVENMRGTIGVESHAGKTVFTISLPLIELHT